MQHMPRFPQFVFAAVIVSALARPALAYEYIVESRAGGQNSGWYSDTECGNSTAKSSAGGCTIGIGSRYSNSTAAQATFTYVSQTTCTHDVFATWGSSPYGDTSVQFTVNYEGGSTTVSLNQKQGAGGENQWNLLGSFPFVAGKTYTVVVTNPTLEGSTLPQRLMADAIKWMPRPGCCPIVDLPIRKPVLPGDTTVTVTNVDPNATCVRVYADNVLIGENNAPAGASEVPVQVLPLIAGQAVCATRVVNNIESCVGIAGPVVGSCEQIPDVRITSIMLAGDTTVRVVGVDPSATSVQIYMNGVLIGTNSNPGGETTVLVTVTALVNGYDVVATQSIRGLEGCLPVPPRVVGDCNQIPPVRVVGMVDAGRTAVRVVDVDPEATGVKVYASSGGIDTLIGTGVPSAGVAVINVSPLVKNHLIKAVQTIRIDACTPASGRRVMAAHTVEDFEDPLATEGTPAPVGRYRTWYDVSNTAYTDVVTASLFGSNCLEILDHGWTNGAYAIFEKIVPAAGNYHLELDMLIDEPTGSDFDLYNQYQVGVVVNGTHRDPTGILSNIVQPVGGYQGLTPAQDGIGSTQPQKICVNNIAANAGDDLLIVFSTNTVGYSRAKSAVGGAPGMKIDNVRLLPGDCQSCQNIPPVAIVASEAAPLEAGGTEIQVAGVNAMAGAVRIYADGVLIGESPQWPIIMVPVAPLVAGQRLWATQIIQGVEGCMGSTGPVVGSGHNSGIRVAMGVRETGQTSGTIGADGGVIGTVEWVGADAKIGNAPHGKLLEPRFTWQTLTFRCTGENADSVMPFDGNGVVTGAYGVLESLAFTIEPPYDTGRYVLYIDSIMNGSTVLNNFDMVAAVPFTQVMFRNPRFSSSTYGNLLDYPDIAEIDTTQSVDHSMRSYRVAFQFRDNSPGMWMRLTTFDDSSTPHILLANPLIDLSEPVTIRFLLLPACCRSVVYDADDDLDVDMVDFAALQRCISMGPTADGGANDPLPGCEVYDYDLSGAVDLLDLVTFDECASGPGVTAQPECR